MSQGFLHLGYNNKVREEFGKQKKADTLKQIYFSQTTDYQVMYEVSILCIVIM